MRPVSLSLYILTLHDSSIRRQLLFELTSTHDDIFVTCSQWMGLGFAESIVVCHSHHLFAWEIQESPCCYPLVISPKGGFALSKQIFSQPSRFSIQCDSSIEFVSRHLKTTRTGDNRRTRKIHNFFRSDFFVRFFTSSHQALLKLSIYPGVFCASTKWQLLWSIERITAVFIST